MIQSVLRAEIGNAALRQTPAPPKNTMRRLSSIHCCNSSYIVGAPLSCLFPMPFAINQFLWVSPLGRRQGGLKSSRRSKAPRKSSVSSSISLSSSSSFAAFRQPLALHKLRRNSLMRQIMAVVQKARIVQRRHRAAIRVLHINRWHGKLLCSQQENNLFQYNTPCRVMQDKRARNRCLSRLIIFLFTSERKYAII